MKTLLTVGLGIVLLFIESVGGRRSSWRPGSSNDRQAPGDPRGSSTERRKQKE